MLYKTLNKITTLSIRLHRTNSNCLFLQNISVTKSHTVPTHAPLKIRLHHNLSSFRSLHTLTDRSAICQVKQNHRFFQNYSPLRSIHTSAIKCQSMKNDTVSYPHGTTPIQMWGHETVSKVLLFKFWRSFFFIRTLFSHLNTVEKEKFLKILRMETYSLKFASKMLPVKGNCQDYDVFVVF